MREKSIFKPKAAALRLYELEVRWLVHSAGVDHPTQTVPFKVQ